MTIIMGYYGITIYMTTSILLMTSIRNSNKVITAAHVHNRCKAACVSPGVAASMTGRVEGLMLLSE